LIQSFNHVIHLGDIKVSKFLYLKTRNLILFLFLFSLVIAITCLLLKIDNSRADLALIVDCDFAISGWVYSHKPYYGCHPKKPAVDFGDERVQIHAVNGTHLSGKSNCNIEKFYSILIEWKKFPTNIEKIFRNLIEVQVARAELSEVTREDLEVFPMLVYLGLHGNRIKFLREDVFTNNLQLEMIDLQNNRFSHIDPRTFSHLKKLKLLDLKGYNNVCESLFFANNKTDVMNMVKSIESGSCFSAEFAPITTENPRDIELALKQEEIKKLKQELEDLKENHKNSITFEQTVVEALKNIKDQNDDLKEKLIKMLREKDEQLAQCQLIENNLKAVRDTFKSKVDEIKKNLN
jgi:hypothetical protein